MNEEKQRRWLRMIDDFNDNEQDQIIDLFGDINSFFEILKSKDLLHLIDPEVDNSSDWVNDWLIHIYESDYKELFYSYVVSYLGDVELKNGKFYLVLKGRDELSEIFCDSSRYNSSRDVAERVLDEDGDYYDPYDNTTNDVYNDVIKELTPKNLQTLYELIIDELKDTNLDTGTELLENLEEEQGYPEFVSINESNIKEIVDDEETMNFLLKNYLGDIKSNLYSVHHNAFNGAYNDEIWEEIWDELSKYFIDRGDYISRPSSSKQPEKTIQYFEIEIRHFESNILEYLRNNSRYGNTGTLYYQGNYTEVLKEDFDCLKLSFPDYPNFRKVDKYINDYFNDYL
jgi:hypothetical protein